MTPQIYRTACTLIRKYGPDAPLHAADRADHMLRCNDLAGRSLWLEVLRVVQDWLDENPPPDDVAVH